ncbi:hypothetical protein ACS0TY_016741 [Phlomoides rotata]
MDQFRITTLTFLFIFSLIIHAISAANDTIDASQSIRDGETLVSSGDVFELGFFSPRNSTNQYLGIWYKNIPDHTVVWVANRESPLRNKSGVLTLTASGNLALLNDTNGTIIWSSNATRSVRNPTALILETGNLVVKDANDNIIVWQSFDHPSDTLLPSMSMGWNYVTGVEIYFSSWRSDDDPAPGEFSIHLDPTGYPQMLIKRGNTTMNRFGPWNGVRFSGSPDSKNDRIYKFRLWRNEKEVMYRENSIDPLILSRSVVMPKGSPGRWVWISQTREWSNYRNTVSDNCDTYNRCGAYGVCNIGNSPPCGCLDRFVSLNPENWIGTQSLNGCERRIPLNCESGDVFLKYSGIKLPDARNSTINEQRMSLSDCEAECSRNCDCTAYARLNISGEGSGCLLYHGDLIDIRTLSTAGQDLYIRMAAAEKGSKGTNRVILIASLLSVAGIGLVCIILFLIFTQRKRKKDPRFRQGVAVEDLPLFSLSTILKATDHFSNNKKLGEGGCGPVYRGVLEDRQEIAVKRLSKSSTQGVAELKNEVILIAKLQHRNLVRTLGFCAEGEESMLIYEYMPNSSLDLIIFDGSKSVQLDWQKRFHIINGIAKGLLYLHQDSRLRIIHRDLKASNILLDADMNPKISDFGLARSFGGNETEAQTSRVVGTYGYMSPEYAIDGLFSIKSDVFSFGVLVLEIVSGKRNRGFCLNDHSLNLLGHAWTLYREGISSDLVNPCLGDSFDLSQVLRSIHVGLLCVQKSPEDRPSMSSVVFMLGNEVTLPEAKKPGFFTERDGFTNQSSDSSSVTNSQNQVTVTRMEGR